MIACFDVHYQGRAANAAAILFDDWASDRPSEHLLVRSENVAEYQAEVSTGVSLDRCVALLSNSLVQSTPL